MTVLVGEVMAQDVATCGADANLVDVATMMRDRDIGDVVITDGGDLRGIVTDRDLVIRGVAAGVDAATTAVATICTEEPAVVTSETDLAEAERIMRERAVRRLPVVDDGRVVGIVSLGDVAIERDGASTLADISASPPDG
jgi:CBS domain-containing protein